MATPGQLIEIAADVLGVAQASVAYAYRSLREHGYVAKSGRGRSAVQVSAADAAALTLCLLVNSAETPPHQAYSEALTALSVSTNHVSDQESDPLLNAIGSLEAGHSLCAALAAMIASNVEARNQGTYSPRGEAEQLFVMHYPRFRTFQIIRAGCNLIYESPNVEDRRRNDQQERLKRRVADDLGSTRYISSLTISVLGALLSNERPTTSDGASHD